MERHIEATTHVRAPVAAIEAVLRDDPGCTISDSVSRDDRAERRFATVLGPRSEGGTAVQQEVLVDLGRVQERDTGIAIAVAWHPVAHERLLPTFDGELRAEPADGGRTLLMLHGTYHVPMGLLGRFGDSVVGQRIARQSVSGLLQDVAGRIDREVDRRNQVPAVSKPAPYPVELRESPRSEYHIG